MVKKVIKKTITKEIKGAIKSSKKKKSISKTKPIQSERSKIAAANAKAAAKRAASKRAASAAAAAKIVSKSGQGAIKAAKSTKTASRPGRGVAATAIGGAAVLTLMNKKDSSGAAKVTFAEAFKKARAKGEGTLFTHNGKKYIAVTKTDLKKKGYDANELAAYNKRGGKARGPLNRLGQGVKKVLLGKDKKFGGDKGVIDFIRKPKKKARGGMVGSGVAGSGVLGKGIKAVPVKLSKNKSRVKPVPTKVPKIKAKPKKLAGGGLVDKRKATGAAKRGFGKAYMKGRRS